MTWLWVLAVYWVVCGIITFIHAGASSPTGQVKVADFILSMVIGGLLIPYVIFMAVFE